VSINDPPPSAGGFGESPVAVNVLVFRRFERERRVKTIGLIGGMSWESSAEYYRLINEEVKVRLGGLHSAQLVIYSVDFADIEAMQVEGRWDEAGHVLGDVARRLERAGVDFVVLCTNTMHQVAPSIEQVISVPLLHIADPTAQAIHRHGLERVGLLATRFTIEREFYRRRIEERAGLSVVVPNDEDRDTVHRIIYEELCLGKILETSRQAYREVMRRLVDRGAEGIILGCTEITLLVAQADATVPLFDTTSLHAQAAVDLALSD
jgi:aspartate racemase